LAENCRLKIKYWGLEILPVWGHLGAQIEIVSTHISSVGNLQLFVEKLQIPAPTLSNP